MAAKTRVWFADPPPARPAPPVRTSPNPPAPRLTPSAPPQFCPSRVPTARPSPAAAAPSPSKTPKAPQPQQPQQASLKALRRQQALALQTEHPDMSEHAAFHIVRGLLTLEGWHLGQLKSQQSDEERRARREEKRKRAPLERAWNSQWKKAQATLVFRTSEGPVLSCLREVHKYQFLTLLDRPLNKLEVFCYYPGDLTLLWPEQVDPSVQAQALRPHERPHERPEFPETALEDCVQSQRPVQVQLYDGLVLRGRVEWNAFYSFLLWPEHAPQSPILVFKHGVLKFRQE